MNQTLVNHLRSWMRQNSVEAWLDSGLDPHGSEYPLSHWRTRYELSGFRGSAGVVVLTQSSGLLCTDSRYWLQAPTEIPPSWKLLQASGDLDQALRNLWDDTPPASLALNPAQWPWERFRRWQEWCKTHQVEFRCETELLLEGWTDRPSPPMGLIRDYEHDFAQDSRLMKLDRLRVAMRQHRTEACLLAALDQIAWILNLRGNDIDYNPLFEAYFYVTLTSATLFCHPECLEEGLETQLKYDGIQVLPLNEVSNSLTQAEQILIDPNFTPAHLALPRGPNLRPTQPFPVALFKSVKTLSEQDGFRRAMVADGVAMVKFMRWWEECHQDLTEGQIAQVLWQFRQESGAWIPSFATISAWGPNGAIVHYDPGEAGVALEAEGLLLLDSGAHYPWGTTDVTRVLFRGEPKDAWREDYTRVLKTLIKVSTTPFPSGTRGYQLDALARGELWANRLHYGHGTGHGVGHVLSVHEGPQRLGPDPNPQELLPGMVVSLEPGLYRSGQWGIRLENLVLIKTQDQNEFAAWLGFEVLTLVPFEPRLIEPTLLNSSEVDWLEAYNTRVKETLWPHLSLDAQEWLQRQTQRWKEILKDDRFS